MTPEERMSTILKLCYPAGDDSRQITPEDFLTKFGVDDGAQLARDLLDDAVDRKDSDDVWAALVVMYEFGPRSEDVDVLKKLALEEWHRSHQSIISLLERMRTDEGIETFYRFTVWSPANIDDETDQQAFANDSIWALYKLGTPAAVETLRRIVTEGVTADSRSLAEERLQELSA